VVKWYFFSYNSVTHLKPHKAMVTKKENQPQLGAIKDKNEVKKISKREELFNKKMALKDKK